MSASPVAAPVRPYPMVRFGEQLVDITTRTLVAGVVDLECGFEGDGGARAQALGRAEAQVAAGADLFSLALPAAGAAPPDVVGAIVDAFRTRFGLPISVRTSRTDVLEAAFAAGAVVGHDVDGTADAAYFALVAAHGATVILGPNASTTPCATVAHRLGADQIVIDAGFDSAPSEAARTAVLRAIASLAACGHPLSLGLPTPDNDDDEAEAATIAWAVLRGARIVRVHDVARVQRACRTLGAILEEAFV